MNTGFQVPLTEEQQKNLPQVKVFRLDLGKVISMPKEVYEMNTKNKSDRNLFWKNNFLWPENTGHLFKYLNPRTKQIVEIPQSVMDEIIRRHKPVKVFGFNPETGKREEYDLYSYKKFLVSGTELGNSLKEESIQDSEIDLIKRQLDILAKKNKELEQKISGSKEDIKEEIIINNQTEQVKQGPGRRPGVKIEKQ